MKRRFREIMSSKLNVLRDVCIQYPVETSADSWIGESKSQEGQLG